MTQTTPAQERYTRFAETVVKTPGLSSPCTMKGGASLLTACGVGFTPHIERKTRPALRLCPPPVATLLHLARAPLAAVHRIGRRGEPRIIEPRQGFFPRGGQALL